MGSDWALFRDVIPAEESERCSSTAGAARLSARAVDQLIDELPCDADLVDEAGSPFASANTLRHTFGTSLRRSGVDVVVVAELMGHRRLATDEEL